LHEETNTQTQILEEQKEGRKAWQATQENKNTNKASDASFENGSKDGLMALLDSSDEEAPASSLSTAAVSSAACSRAALSSAASSSTGTASAFGSTGVASAFGSRSMASLKAEIRADMARASFESAAAAPAAPPPPPGPAYSPPPPAAWPKGPSAMQDEDLLWGMLEYDQGAVVRNGLRNHLMFDEVALLEGPDQAVLRVHELLRDPMTDGALVLVLLN